MPPLSRRGTGSTWKYSKWTELYGPDIWKKVKGMQNLACISCALACKVNYKIKDGEFKGLTSFTGHYTLPARVGQRLEIEDYREAVKLLDLCNRAGMCYFTTSSIVNWITRLYEKRRISKEETGLELERNFDLYLDLFERIASREEVGDLLADGWYPISNKIDVDGRELKKRGERAFNLFKIVNIREGFSREENTCSKIWLTPRETPDETKEMMDYYKEKRISKEEIRQTAG